MFEFFKKKEEPQQIPRRFYIPRESIPEIYTLLDRYHETKKKLDRFRLWEAIEKLFPCTKEGDWTLKVDDITRPFIYEALD